jgi:hypothetical protein
MHFSRHIFWCFHILMGLTTVFGVERSQIDPNSFYEVDMRYTNLKQPKNFLSLSRPWDSPNFERRESLLLQLKPTLNPNGNKHDAGLASWIQLNLNQNLVIINEMRLNYASQNDSSYIGKEWRSISGFTNQSFLLWQPKLSSKGDLNIQIGRFHSQLGSGRHGQLLLGANARPMDQLSLSFGHPISKGLAARFFFQTSALDKIGADKRFLSLHRLELLGNKWYVALSEALTYTRNSHGIDLVYLNPFIFYHLEQLNGPDLSGNTIGTLELGYRWNTSNIYAEILIDDVQFDNKVKSDLEPNEVGGLLGYEYAGEKYYLSIEGVSLTNRTYKTPNPSEWYLHRNKPVGYELGSDVGRINLLARYYVKQDWHIDAQIDMIWQGEGDLAHTWDSPWDDESVAMETGYSESFPTGVVEKTNRFSFEVMRHWNRERWIGLGLSYNKTCNVSHIQDQSDSEFNVSLNASWTLSYEKIFED